MSQVRCVRAPLPKRPAPAEAAGGGSAESCHILAVLQALTERLGRLEDQRGPPSLPSGMEGLPLRRPDSQDEREDEADDVLSLLASQATEDTTGGAGHGGETRTDSRGGSTGVGETPVSSLMSRVLSAANILGLQPPTLDPVLRGVFGRASRALAPHLLFLWRRTTPGCSRPVGTGP